MGLKYLLNTPLARFWKSIKKYQITHNDLHILEAIEEINHSYLSTKILCVFNFVVFLPISVITNNIIWFLLFFGVSLVHFYLYKNARKFVLNSFLEIENKVNKQETIQTEQKKENFQNDFDEMEAEKSWIDFYNQYIKDNDLDEEKIINKEIGKTEEKTKKNKKTINEKNKKIENYLYILELPNDTRDLENIKKQYRLLIKKYHPEKCEKGDEKIKNIIKAYHKLRIEMENKNIS